MELIFLFGSLSTGFSLFLRINFKDNKLNRFVWTLLILGCVFFFPNCGVSDASSTDLANVSPTVPVSAPAENDQKTMPPAAGVTPQPEERTDSPLGKFDFKNYTYPLPRGWHGAMNEITLENGSAPLSLDEENRKIGASYVRTKYGDVTGDGHDEAFVVVKIETGGAALPQVVYVFEWQNEKPEIIWYFRSGDRADGGLRDLRAENGEMVVELYGQDRYILGDVETMKITGDEEQLCCPTYFTRTRYKLTGNRFVLQGKRRTYKVAEPDALPVENMGQVETPKNKGQK